MNDIKIEASPSTEFPLCECGHSMGDHDGYGFCLATNILSDDGRGGRIRKGCPCRPNHDEARRLT